MYEHLDRPVHVRSRDGRIHTYYNVYYAEQTALVKPGTRVKAGQFVMSGGEDELGFASRNQRDPSPQGPLVVVPATSQHGRYTKPTTEGLDFYAWLQWIARHS